jgi:anti-anti-sigma factor
MSPLGSIAERRRSLDPVVPVGLVDLVPKFSLGLRDDEPDTSVIEVRGEVDLATVEQLRAMIGSTIARRVVVDLEGCEFVDSTGIATILLSARELAKEGRALEVERPSGQVLRVLEMTGLTGVGGFPGGRVHSA